MKTPKLSPLLISSLCVASSGCISAQGEENDKMNVVIILADDLGWGDVGFHGSKIMTPNLDKLASKGIEMTRFYTAPVSSPTRAGLMTGRYPNRFGIRETVIPPWRDFGLDTEQETIADLLAKAGYSNQAIIGKWHLGHSQKKYYPLERGFTHFYGHLNGAIDYFTHERENELDWHRNWDSSYDKGYSTDLITNEAVNCINEYSKDKNPFLLYVAYNAPHTPLQAKPEDLALYTDNPEGLTKKEKKIATFSAMVTCMDRGIGRIMNTLKENGIEENTLVIFFSDNGAEPNGGGTNAPLRGSKFTEWDGGVRVPAIISYPAKFGGGRKIDQVTGFVDIVPTLCAMLSVSCKADRPFDGMDISPLLTGKTKTLKRDFYLGCGAVVNNDFKFVLPGMNNSMKLNSEFISYYSSDPYESSNAIDKFPVEAKRLKSIAEKYDSIQPPFKVLPYGEGREGFIAPKEWKIER